MRRRGTGREAAVEDRLGIRGGDRLCACRGAGAGGAPAEAATEQPATAAEQPTTEVPAETDLFAPEQPDILVAPVALYPDPLLVLVLQGSTFPVEVVAANRFLGKLRRC